MPSNTYREYKISEPRMSYLLKPIIIKKKTYGTDEIYGTDGTDGTDKTDEFYT